MGTHQGKSEDIPIFGEYISGEGYNITGEAGTRMFPSVVAAIGYGSPEANTSEYQGHAMAIMGIQKDDRINLVGEATGPPAGLLRKVIAWKDAVGFKEIYVPVYPEQYFLHYAGGDGLTYYRSVGRNRDGGPIYARKPEDYPGFRTYSHVCSVAPVPEELDAEFPAYLSAYQAMAARGSALTADWCVKAITLSREGRRAIDHPLAKAIVYCAAILSRELSPKSVKPETSTPNSWYGNRL